ncbi:MAG: DUF2802 domain-containing protein [Proteobacteria bacterium]|nr:DUF2802 domain-containing protein [Pseudomonadota bacterium]
MNSLLIGSFFISLVLAKILFSQWKGFRKLKKEAQDLKDAFDEIKLNHHLLVNADLSFGKQIAEINKQILSLDNHLQQLENKRDNDGGYQHALRILEMGGSREEIIGNCHLSNAEAELLMNLSAYRMAIKKQQSEV